MTLVPSLDRLDNCLHNRDGQNPFAEFDCSSGKFEQSFLECLAGVRTPAKDRENDAIEGDTASSDSLSARLRQTYAQVRALIGSGPCPVLAITGLLNAGKTSLVAGFLSPVGRSRLLIGQSNAQGTHRFVVWLPHRWREDSGLWESVVAQLESVFEHRPEELSDDPASAFQQYNGSDSQRPLEVSMRIPLIATDAGLNQWNIGLMDCPDIQTGLVSVANRRGENAWRASDAVARTAADRERILRQALHIASAFIVVTSANSLQDEYVDRLLDASASAMPGLNRILVINRVPRRYTVSDIANESKKGYSRHHCWRTYMAYHFDGPQSRERIPVLATDSLSLVADRDQASVALSSGKEFGSDGLPSDTLPTFFRIDHDAAAQPPELVPEADFFVNLGRQLAPSRLSDDLSRVTLANLRGLCFAGVESFRDRIASESKQGERMQQLLAQACLSLSMVETNGSAESGEPDIRLQVSREIVGQVAESLERTAPWWAMPGRRMMRWSEQLRFAASGVTQWITLPSWVNDRLKSSSDWVRSRWRSGDGGKVISASKFFDAVSAHDRVGDLIHDEVDDRTVLLPRLNAIIERFQAESRTRLNDEQLDAYTQEMWRRMSWRQKLWTGLAPAGILFAPLLAVVMLPLDFGGSTVLVFASLKELLFAGAAGVGMAMFSTDHMPKIAEKEAAWQQLSDLHAIACDEFSVSRPSNSQAIQVHVGKSSKALLPSLIEERRARSTWNTPRLVALNPKFIDSLENALASLEHELGTGS